MSLDEDVPMSLDDDADDMKKVEKRIRKKEMSLDDDDYANLEKLKRKKILCTVDVDVGAVRLESMTQIDNFPPDDDLKPPSKLSLWHLKFHLPALAEAFRTKDWSLLRKYCILRDSSSTQNLSLEEALEHELVPTCFLFLLTKECPPNVKECLVSALQFILSMIPKATNMSIDQEEGVDYAPRKMSIDQASIEALMVDALRLGDKEIIRQVSTIVYICAVLLMDTVGTSLHSELVKVACSFPSSCDALGAIHVLEAIRIINSKFEDGEMREKLVEAVLSNTEWLLNMMRDHDIELVLEAYNILEFLTLGGYDAGIWEALEDDFIPQILESCSQIYGKPHRIRAAKIIANTISGASPEQIGDLVYGMDRLLPYLLSFLDIDEDVRSVCMVAFENILKADEEESCYNIYAIKIGEVLRKGYGWDLLYNEAPNSEDLLVKYAPDEWLVGKYNLWCRREEMLEQCSE